MAGGDDDLDHPLRPAAGPRRGDVDPSGDGSIPRASRGRISDGVYHRRRAVVGGGVAAVVAGAVALIGWNSRSDPPPDRSRVLPIDAWAPHWALDNAVADLPARAPLMRELSPFWFSATADAVNADAQADPAETTKLVEIARRMGVPVTPSITDSLPSGGMAAVLADPTRRAAHVAMLVAFATDGGYDGLDIDYEQFAFADDRSTWATTRPNWVSFVSELAAALHGAGLTLSVSIPPVYDAGQTSDSGYWVYDYASIAPMVDRIRVMAYDYAPDAPGPVAPLEWVHRVVDGVTAVAGDRDKLVLGVPLYGYNFPTKVSGTCPTDQDVGRTVVRTRDAVALFAKRAAATSFDQTTGEWTATYTIRFADATTACVQTRVAGYLDAAAVVARAEIARTAGWAGISLWAFGYDDQSVWDALVAANAPYVATSTTTPPSTDAP